MNILYIIGNGLDIALHMKTSYQDFFKYYLSLSSGDEDIQTMKKDIKSKKYETWADLEIGLGIYSSQCASKQVFLKCLFDIKTNLREYLKKESELIANYILKSFADFENPSRFMAPKIKSRYDDYRNRMSPGEMIDIITLNYTTTLETLLGYSNSPIVLSSNTRLRSIQHVHGTLDNMMVMGVNDSSQVLNAGFNSDIDIVEEFVKPEYNDACMNNKNTICESLIQNADMIVLYGTSLGQSDNKWWKLIGQRMGTDRYPLLIYLPYDQKKDLSLEPNHLRRWALEYVSEIREKFDIKVEEKELASRMCVALNKLLFPITKSVKNPINT